MGGVRGGVGANADPAPLVAAINDCPEVDGTVDPDDADLVELAFEVVLPTWEAAGAVDTNRRMTALGVWGLPRARPGPEAATSTPPTQPPELSASPRSPSNLFNRSDELCWSS